LPATIAQPSGLKPVNRGDTLRRHGEVGSKEGSSHSEAQSGSPEGGHHAKAPRGWCESGDDTEASRRGTQGGDYEKATSRGCESARHETGASRSICFSRSSVRDGSRHSGRIGGSNCFGAH
jgi:hypothetical protein